MMVSLWFLRFFVSVHGAIQQTKSLLRVFVPSCNKKSSLKPFDERSQENEIFEKIDTSTIFQIPSICSSLFLSYLPKHVTRFYNTMYGDAMLVFLRRTPIWRPEINKNIWG